MDDSTTRFLCLVYIDPALAGAASPEVWQEIQKACLDYNEELKRNGNYVASNGLAEPRTAVTLRRRNDRLAMTDGPFAETKEYLGGFFLIVAPNRDVAMAIAGRSPMARMGAIEVRATAGF